MNTDPAELAKELREIVGRRLLSLYGDAAPISQAATLLEQMANTMTAEEVLCDPVRREYFAPGAEGDVHFAEYQASLGKTMTAEEAREPAAKRSK